MPVPLRRRGVLLTAAPLPRRRMTDELEFTGERFIPGAAGEIWYEHWHRYHFAANLVGGREVLDVACGDGYGSALLARHASACYRRRSSSLPAIEHARSAYAGDPNLEFREADCAALPFRGRELRRCRLVRNDRAHRGQEAFLDEVRRVLRPGGLARALVSEQARIFRPARLHQSVPRARTLSRRTRSDARRAIPARAMVWAADEFFSVVWPERESPCADLSRFPSRRPRPRRPGMRGRFTSSSPRATTKRP